MLLDNQKVNEEVNKLNNKAIVKTNKKNIYGKKQKQKKVVCKEI